MAELPEGKVQKKLALPIQRSKKGYKRLFAFQL